MGETGRSRPRLAPATRLQSARHPTGSHDVLAAAALENAVDAYWAADARGILTAWNASSEKLFGWPREEVLGRPFIELIVPERTRASVLADVRRHVETGQSPVVGRVIEQVALRHDGTEIPVSIAVSTVGSGELTTFHAFIRQIPEHEDLARILATYRGIVDANTDGIIVVGRDGLIAVANPAAAGMYGYGLGEMVGKPAAVVVPPSETDDFAHGLSEAFAGSTTTDVQERVRKDGTSLTARVIVHPIRDEGGSIRAACVRTRDVTAQAEAERDRDSSRRLLRSIIESAPIAIAVRDAKFNWIMVNGPAADLMQNTAEQMIGKPDSATLPPSAIAQLRVGDHRVLAGETVTEESMTILGDAKRVIAGQRFRIPLSDNRGDFAIVGFGMDVTEQRQAEAALAERTAWQDYITEAVREKRIAAYSQPIIDLATGAPVGEELLVRMRGTHSPDDVVLPGEFLPQVEKLGLIQIVDRFMLGKALTLARRGRAVSVNISAVSLRDESFAEEIVSRLEASGAAAANVTLEITETAAQGALATARMLAARLNEMGASLALDDFGTGFGSFTELREVDVRVLKIHAGFVVNVDRSEKDQHVVRTIVAIAREFGLTSIAEGVETAETLAMLRRMGVDQAQGFLFAKPAPID